MSDLCDFCKKERNEVYYKEVEFTNGETDGIFLCADCFNKRMDETVLKEIYKNKTSNINVIYDELKIISEKLSKIIRLIEDFN